MLVCHRNKERAARPVDEILLDIPAFAQLKEGYERLLMNREDMNYTFQSRFKEFSEKLKEK